MFLSIVIANYNYGIFLEDAINSILNQSCDDYEIIIVDGKSTDNSVDIIKKYESKIAWWVSEPDHGQSNAFNKGFRHAKGEFLTWLNADDIMLPDTILNVKKTIRRNPNKDWATGNFVRFNNSTNKIIEVKWGPHFLPYFLQTPNSPDVIFGPSTFFRKSLYERLGPIDENMFFMMDIEYWLRLKMNGYKQVRINHYCWAFRMHEGSKTAEYDGHVANSETKAKKEKERTYMYEKTGFNPSKTLRLIGLVFRLIDGSFFKTAILRFNLLNKDIRVLIDKKGLK